MHIVLRYSFRILVLMMSMFLFLLLLAVYALILSCFLIRCSKRLRSPCFRVCLAVEEEVVEVACGKMHSLALTKSGRIFSWGAAQAGT
jgi:hypothetical protein